MDLWKLNPSCTSSPWGGPGPSCIAFKEASPGPFLSSSHCSNSLIFSPNAESFLHASWHIVTMNPHLSVVDRNAIFCSEPCLYYFWLTYLGLTWDPVERLSLGQAHFCIHCRRTWCSREPVLFQALPVIHFWMLPVWFPLGLSFLFCKMEIIAFYGTGLLWSLHKILGCVWMKVSKK